MTQQNERNGTTSRLDPEPVPRRDFLGLAALWTMLGAGLFAILGMLRLPRAAVIPEPSKKFRVQLPDGLQPHEPYFPPDRNVAVFRDSAGIYAISRICTHLGCVVKDAPDGFACPCHGSEFEPNGSVRKGPAPKALPWLAVKVDGSDVVIDEGETVDQGTKVT